MKFALDVPTLWRPLFTIGKEIRTSTVQMEDLPYVEPKKENTIALEREIYQTLVSKVEKWRGRHVTRWNRYV